MVEYPADWKWRTLGSCATVKARIGWQGLTTAEYLKDGDHYLVNGVNIENGQVNWQTCFMVDEKRYAQDKNIQLQNFDVLVSKDGTIGKVAYVENMPRTATLNSGVFVIRSVDAELSQEYLARVFLSTWFDAFIKKITAGSTIVHLYQKDIVQFSFQIPPLPEQKRIAAVLSNADKLIANVEKQIAKKRAIKQGAMQELLTGKKRLPGFSGEWRSLYLGSIADIRTGKRNGDEQKTDGMYPFFVRSQSVYRIDSYSYDGEAIIIPGEGGIGSIFHYINGRFDFHQRVYKVSDFPCNISCQYVYYYMKQFFGKYALQNTVKATVDSLRLPTFQNFTVNMPASLDEQQAIAKVLSGMDAEIANLERKLEKLKLIKQGMMQDLLTGKVRLKQNPETRKERRT